jgi:diguanylate cyclase (GGDEF)-like protein
MIRGARMKDSPSLVFEAGARDYLTKPLDDSTVVARVDTHLELQRIRDLTAHALSLDTLTEVPDRRGVEEFLDMEWGRAAREATPISLILIRVDHFESLVKQRGRLVGDDCLRTLAEELTNSVRRPMDFLGRYAEDTFAVVLPVTESHGATYLAERMCEQVEFLEIPHPGSETLGYVTTSAGVATILPFPGSTPKPLIDAAADGLDRATKEGGNRVEPVEPIVE